MPSPRPAQLDALFSPRGEIQSLMRIRSARGKVVPFHFNPAQEHYAQHATSRDIILKRRRLGFSTLKLAEGLARAAFLGERCGIVSHNMRLTREFLRVVGLMYDSIPSQFRPEADRRNADEMVFKPLGGSLTIGTARADLFGRGDTFQFIHWSEVAHSPVPVDRDIWLGMSEAASEGDISWESTANGQAGLFYEEVLAALGGDTPWTLHFYPWWWGADTLLLGVEWPDLGPLDPHEEYLRTHEGLDAGRIAWRRQKRRQLGPKFAQEYPESVLDAFIASGSNYFDPLRLQEVMRQCRPAVKGVSDTGLHVWEAPMSTGLYAIGADCGGGGGNYVDDEGDEQSDASAAAIINVRTGRVVATFVGRVKPDEFAELLMLWGKQYHDAYLTAERNGPGAVVNRILVERGYPAVYMEKTSDARWAYGWYTSKQSRFTLLADFDEALRAGAVTVEDARLVQEAMTFTSKTDALGRVRYAAAPGAHDDLLFAHMIAWHIRDQVPEATRTKPVIRGGSVARLFPV